MTYKNDNTAQEKKSESHILDLDVALGLDLRFFIIAIPGTVGSLMGRSVDKRLAPPLSNDVVFVL